MTRSGFRDESIRIAVVLRVLFHNTKHSTSLITHLGAQNIKLASTCHDIFANIPGMKSISDMKKYDVLFRGMGVVKIGGRIPEFVPKLDSSGIESHLNINQWLEQIVWVINRDQILKRKTIILSAANKDGGAHVDDKLTPEYESLSADGAAGVFYGKISGQKFRQEITDAHYVSLRQMAFEVLNSNDLMKLTA